jgi:inosine-uridine nucleoside N-ribohydrolase
MKIRFRRSYQPLLVLAAILACLAGAAPLAGPADAAQGRARKIPVILDSDIGDDIDDTWALGYLLRSQELDLKLVVGDEGKPLYRAKLIAKLLQAAGRTDVPVGVGMETANRGEGPQAAWVRGYNLNTYPGKVYPDGVQALIDTIMSSREPVTLLAIGPLPNVAAALEREPRIAQRARFVGMHGSVRVGYGRGTRPAPEYNVKQNPAACQKAFTAPWDITITPLDTCGIVDLDGERYARLRRSTDPIARAILENYQIWSGTQQRRAGQPDPFETRSSTLFDTVAVYLAYTDRLLKMERLPIAVTDDGMTVIRPGAKEINVATEWRDLDGFRDHLVERLTSRERRR